MREAFAAAAALLLVSVLLTPAFSSPLSPQTLRSYLASNQGLQGRNIRNLECVSRKTQEKGICMFALSCLKLNGTHLGVCVDRFYYGSCCKMPDEHVAEVGVGDGDNNDISSGLDNGVFGKPPVTQASEVEEPSTSRPLSTTVANTPAKPVITTAKPTIAPTRKPVVTNKPVTTKPVTVTIKPVVSGTTKPTSKPQPSKPVVTTQKPIVTSKPGTATSSKPVTTPTKRPSNQTAATPTKPVSNKPVITTVKPTTVAKPSNTTRPTTTVTKPTSPKPSGTTKPPSKPSSTAKPITKPTVKPTTAATPKPVITTAKPVTTTTISNEVVPSKRPEIPDGPLVEPVEAEEENTNTVTGTKPPVTTAKPVSPAKPPATVTKPPSTPGKPSPTTPSTVATKPTTAATKPTTVAKPTPPTWPPSIAQKPVTTLAPSSEATTVSSSSTITTVAAPSNTTESEWVQIDLTTPVWNATQGSPFTEKIPTKAPPSSSEVVTLPPTTTASPMEPELNMSDYKAVCGRRLHPEARIVGGTRTTFGKWPWQISLRQWRTSTYLHKCGAALLNENWAITAAHCVENVPPADLLLRLGEHDLSTDSEPYSHVERRVQIVASHPQFDSRTFEYDLALLRFYEPVQFKPNVVPICIPDTDRNFVGSNAYVTGWGRLYEDGPLPSVMQEVSVPVLRNEDCETMYRSAGYIEHIPHIFICAGWKKGGFDSCEGDSGGPMVIQREDNRWTLAGVISWGIGCAEPNQPGVYTRISEFRDWINQILQF